LQLNAFIELSIHSVTTHNIEFSFQNSLLWFIQTFLDLPHPLGFSLGAFPLVAPRKSAPALALNAATCHAVKQLNFFHGPLLSLRNEGRA
jgi:hypothetical protein